MIKNIVIDCDGVLTDGKKYVDRFGRRCMITFHSRDDIAIARLIDIGYSVFILTASDFTGIHKYWGRKGVEVISTDDKGEVDVIDWSETMGIGDDSQDAFFLHKCAQAYVVADASPDMLAVFPALKTKGGEGVMSEILRKMTITYKVTEKSTVA